MLIIALDMKYSEAMTAQALTPKRLTLCSPTTVTYR